jgi:uncharacterized protein (TIGR02266 family)
MAGSAIARNGTLDGDTSGRSRIALLPEQIVLEFEVTTSSESQFFAGLTGDVSHGGIFIETYQPVPIGSRVAVSLSLPTGDVEVFGVVEWTRDARHGMSPGVGVAFEELPPDARLSLEQFCRLRAPLYHDSGAE